MKKVWGRYYCIEHQLEVFCWSYKWRLLERCNYSSFTIADFFMCIHTHLHKYIDMTGIYLNNKMGSILLGVLLNSWTALIMKFLIFTNSQTIVISKSNYLLVYRLVWNNIYMFYNAHKSQQVPMLNWKIILTTSLYLCILTDCKD